MKTRKQICNKRGGPAGSSAPTLPNTVANPVDIGFLCEFPECDRKFDTVRGRGVHHQKVHKNWYDAQLRIPGDKTRWTEEESALLARKEAELTLRGGIRFMNQELYKFFPQRTIEAIKGRRKRQDHRDLVESYLKEVEDLQQLTDMGTGARDPDDIMGFLDSLPRPGTDAFRAQRLYDIASEARRIGRRETLHSVAMYLREVFPPPTSREHANNKCTRHSAEGQMTRRQARKKEYATMQILWKKNRSRCVANILGETGNVSQPPRAVMEPYWTNIMSTTSDSSPNLGRNNALADLWRPITMEELQYGRVALQKSAGPDGVSARLLRSMPDNTLVRLYNLLIWCGRLPESLLASKTIFLPKKANAREPGDFRPISVSSVITRGLHKILAKRLSNALQLDERQRAFRETDGCADNTFLLDTVLRYHRGRFRSLYMASLDVSKAFDSISHPAIMEILRSLGVPESMLEYMVDVYKNSTTVLIGDTWSSPPIRPQRGVRQGDPLSPVIFNIMTHVLLNTLPREIGVCMGGSSINAAAYADDLLLFASTPEGLQELINRTGAFLQKCGMRINVEKSLTISIKASPHLKKTAVDVTTTFNCEGRKLPTLSRESTWRYLGVDFTPEGRSVCKPMETIRPLLEALTRAPLKPQQRLFALRTFVLPKLYHQLALGAVTIGTLNKVDRLTRRVLRQWIKLPHDVPNAYFHAAVKDGGLGIPAMRWMAPLLRRGRLIAAKRAYMAQEMNGYADNEITKCTRRLTDQGTVLNTTELIATRWARKLYATIDGAGLHESGRTSQQHQWIADGCRFLSGKDFVNCCRIRISALPTRSRTSRGRNSERDCRAGCLAQETLNHVLQQCHRTHAGRIRRHDAVLSYLERGIKKSGYVVHREPHYNTASGLRKPDLVAIMGHTAVIVDAQVVGEQINLDQAHTKKIRYYEDNAVARCVREMHKVDRIITTSATLSWKGVWSPRSAEHLEELGLLRKKDLKVVTSRVLIGGIAEFRLFNAITSTIWQRRRQ